MSRVFKPSNRFGNSPRYSKEIIKAGDVKISYLTPEARQVAENRARDYHYATSLIKWLLLKYGLTYKTFRRKSAKRRAELREEFFLDTTPDGYYRAASPYEAPAGWEVDIREGSNMRRKRALT